MRKRAILYGIVCLFLAALVTTALNMYNKPVDTALSYPTKAITMIVPFAAGGSTDMIARSLEKQVIKQLGQPLIITNISGGGGTIGWNELAAAKPDGYTIGIISSSALVQPLYGQTKYHYPTALAPLVQIINSPHAIVVMADSPWQNINDLIEYAKTHPEVKYGHPGLGSAPHIVGEYFALKAGIKISQVPFRGDSETLAALLGGHVQFLIAPPFAITEYVKSGKVRILALTSEKRLTEPIFKDAPTFREQGVDVVFSTFWGIGAPKIIPKEIKNKLAGMLGVIVNDPEFKQNIERLGMTVEYMGEEEFEKKWLYETERLIKILKETGIAEKVAAQKN